MTMKKFFAFIIVVMMTIIMASIDTSYKDNLKYVSKDKIVFVPLDTRPVSLQNVDILAKAGGKELLVPPMDALDDYKKKSNQDMIYDWLKGAVERPDISAVIISTNQFISGGLIASRSYINDINYKESLERLKQIMDLANGKRIVLISIMPQVSSVLYQQDTIYVQNRANIDYYKQVKKAISENDTKTLERLKLSMPSYLFNCMAVIASEALINEQMASDLKPNVTLTIGLDDTTMKSMLKYSYDDLKSSIKGHKNVYMLHGADEISMMTVAKILNEENGLKPSYKIVYEESGDENNYLLFEGGTVKEITEEKIGYIGGETSQDAKNIIYIHMHKNYKTGIKNVVSKYKISGQNFGVADVAKTNGGDKDLVDEILKDKLITSVDAYSGWNTPSNTIGTVVSELSIKSYIDTKKDKNALEDMQKYYYAFTFIRYADDYIYQSIVRDEMQNWAKTNGLNPDNLTNKNEADDVLKEKMKPYLDTLMSVYADCGIKIKGADVEYPWNRMFEIKIAPILD
ncbi:hypothetical protein V518_0391 [Thermoanaerobacterium aotearoense SCUT27]|uniref:DUF4127 family protein n=3 Tax=Thermoanaerobacterium TaxID=28895 RepID=W9EBM0_9THEO|nr:hypothetical protein Tsac_0362 [Thermoanaerobacterium saccharolyticum JW/SL-YS485]ETO39457.1 hypothetical protein V518_0391 [Thermoanaerobacterium aotearoense SCUT27]